MKRKKLNILFSILRAFASYACFSIIQFITVIMFNAETSLERFYEVYGEVSPVQSAVYCTIAIIAIMFLTVYGFSLWNKKEKCAYLASGKRRFSVYAEARSIIRSAEFLAEVGVYGFFTLLSSALYLFGGVGKAAYTLKYILRLFFPLYIRFLRRFSRFPALFFAPIFSLKEDLQLHSNYFFRFFGNFSFWLVKIIEFL